MHVYRSDPNQRGFSQPCPLWKGQCTIYTSPHYPRACRSYKCKLLKEMLGGNTSLPNALKVVEQAKGMIRELEALLPILEKTNFRERLVKQLENSTDTDLDLRQLKADALLIYYEEVFGVKDVVDKPDEE